MLGRFPGIQAPFVPYSRKVTIFIISQIFIFLVYWNIQQKNTLVQAGFCYVRLIFLKICWKRVLDILNWIYEVNGEVEYFKDYIGF